MADAVSARRLAVTGALVRKRSAGLHEAAGRGTIRANSIACMSRGCGVAPATGAVIASRPQTSLGADLRVTHAARILTAGVLTHRWPGGQPIQEVGMITEVVTVKAGFPSREIRIVANFGVMNDPSSIRCIADMISFQVNLAEFETDRRNVDKFIEENPDYKYHTQSQMREEVWYNMVEEIRWNLVYRMHQILPQFDLTPLPRASLESLLEEVEEDYDLTLSIPYPAQDDKWQSWVDADKKIVDYVAAALALKQVGSGKPTGQPGFVYLLRSVTGFYKIGRTKNPKDRLRTFGVLLPFEVEYEHIIPTDDMGRAEMTLHDRYAQKRGNGEWFMLSEQDVIAIKAIQRM